MCPPPLLKIHTLKPNLQCVHIWRQGLLGVTRSWQWSPHECALIKDTPEFLSLFYYVREQQKDHCLWTRKKASTRHRNFLWLFWLPSLQNCKFLLLIVCPVYGILCVCAQSCLILCNPMDCSLPGSSVHGILQARILEWAAISYSRGSFQSWDRTHISCRSWIGRRVFYHWTTWEDNCILLQQLKWTKTLLIFEFIFNNKNSIMFYLKKNATIAHINENKFILPSKKGKQKSHQLLYSTVKDVSSSFLELKITC